MARNTCYDFITWLTAEDGMYTDRQEEVVPCYGTMIEEEVQAKVLCRIAPESLRGKPNHRAPRKYILGQAKGPR